MWKSVATVVAWVRTAEGPLRVSFLVYTGTAAAWLRSLEMVVGVVAMRTGDVVVVAAVERAIICLN